jgi:hypothetical protein
MTNHGVERQSQSKEIEEEHEKVPKQRGQLKILVQWIRPVIFTRGNRGSLILLKSYFESLLRFPGQAAQHDDVLEARKASRRKTVAVV